MKKNDLAAIASSGAIRCFPPRLLSVLLAAALASVLAVPGRSVPALEAQQGTPPTVTVATSDPEARETGSKVGRFQVYRTGETDLPLAVHFALSGTAIRGVDYTLDTESPVIIPVGQASKSITVTAISDSIIEGDESCIITLVDDGAYVVGVPKTATVMIIDKPIVIVTAPDPIASESTGEPGEFQFYRTGDLSAPMVVAFTLSGTATAGVDYSVSATTSVLIAANLATASLRVYPIPDDLIEGDETIVLTLVEHGGYNVGTPSSATIILRDKPTITVTAPVAIALEAGLTTGTFLIQRSGETDRDLVARFEMSGTARLGEDYTLNVVQEITIPAGQSSRAVVLTPLDDELLENDETAILTVVPNAGTYNVGVPASATITIRDKPAVTVTAIDPVAHEADGRPGVFRISRTGVTTAPLPVRYTLGGTATAEVDYRIDPPTPVVIPAGADSVTVSVTPLADDEMEGDETVTLTVVENRGADNLTLYNIGVPNAATVTIIETPTVSVTAPDPVASEPGDNTGTFLLTRTGRTEWPLAVHYTLSGTATPGIDYTLDHSSPATIPAGSATLAITLTPINDLLIEPPETAILSISPAAGGYQVAEPSSATITILDKPVVGVTAPDPVAHEVGLRPGRFRVFREAEDRTSSMTVSYTMMGTAEAGVDYVMASFEQAVIPAGASAVDLIVTPLADDRIEGPETIILMLTADQWVYNVGPATSATITLHDKPAATIRALTPAISESGVEPGRFEIALSGPSDLDTQIGFALSGTATPLVDYVLGTTSPAVIPAGALSTIVYLHPIDDDQPEADETVTVTLQAGPGYHLGTPSQGTILLLDNDQTPIIEPLPDQTIFAYTPYAGPVPRLVRGAADRWSLLAGPEGMTIDAETGQVFWSNPTLTVATHVVTIRAENWAGRDETSWRLHVTLNPEEYEDVDWDLYRIVYRREGRQVGIDDFKTTMGLVIAGGGKYDTLNIRPRIPGARVPALPLVYTDGNLLRLVTRVDIGKLEAPKRVWDVTALKSHISYLDVGELRLLRMAARADGAHPTAPTYATTSIISRGSAREMRLRLAGVILEDLVSHQNIGLIQVQSVRHVQTDTGRPTVALGGIGPVERVVRFFGAHVDQPEAMAEPDWSDTSLIIGRNINQLVVDGCPIVPNAIQADVVRVRTRGRSFWLGDRPWPAPAHIWMERLESGADSQVFRAIGGDIKIRDLEVENPILELTARFVRAGRARHIAALGGVVGFEADGATTNVLSAQPVYTMRVASRLGNIVDVHGDLGIFGVFMSGADEDIQPNYKGNLRTLSTRNPANVHLPARHPVGIYGEAHIAFERLGFTTIAGDVECVNEGRFRFYTSADSPR